MIKSKSIKFWVRLTSKTRWSVERSNSRKPWSISSSRTATTMMRGRDCSSSWRSLRPTCKHNWPSNRKFKIKNLKKLSRLENRSAVLLKTNSHTIKSWPSRSNSKNYLKVKLMLWLPKIRLSLSLTESRLASAKTKPCKSLRTTWTRKHSKRWSTWWAPSSRKEPKL